MRDRNRPPRADTHERRVPQLRQSSNILAFVKPRGSAGDPLTVVISEDHVRLRSTCPIVDFVRAKDIDALSGTQVCRFCAGMDKRAWAFWPDAS